jgi:hypothetical protein
MTSAKAETPNLTFFQILEFFPQMGNEAHQVGDDKNQYKRLRRIKRKKVVFVLDVLAWRACLLR